MRHCKAQVTALELMAACSSAVQHEAQASWHHRLLLLPQLPRSSQPHAVKACLVRQTLVPISLLHVPATTARHALDATRNAPSQDNVEAGTRVASAEEMTSLHAELRRRRWTMDETIHVGMTGEAAMTVVSEMEDTGAAPESKNKAAARCRMHRVHSMVVRRKCPHHHQARLQETHQSGSVAHHAMMLHLSTTGAAAEVVNSELEEAAAADARTTGAEVADLGVRKT
jgi:hypothetical protein